MLLETMKEKYLEYVRNSLTIGTYNFYRVHLNCIISYFIENGLKFDNEINSKKLYEYVRNTHLQNVKNSTINKRILVLKNMFKYNDVDNEILSFKKLREEKTTFNALSKNELIKVVDYLNSDCLKDSNKLLIFLLIDTGARINEILNIKVSNIDLINRTIYLEKTKTHIPRFVPFTTATKVLLENYLKQTNDNSLFKITLSSVESLCRRIKQRLSLSRFHPHMLRHTLATKLHNNGVSIMIIQKIMGHQNITTTERYVHFDIDDIMKSYDNVMN